LISVVAQIIRTQVGVVLNPFTFDPVMLWEPAAFIALGALAGIIPAIKAYRTDVAKNLTPLS
jgi:putative ABC transport system permease protein